VAILKAKKKEKEDKEKGIFYDKIERKRYVAKQDQIHNNRAGGRNEGFERKRGFKLESSCGLRKLYKENT
jgi:hypothetical protein